MKISKYDGDPLILRQSIAEADLKDGRTVEVSLSLGGGALIGMLHGANGKHIATYQISPTDFINEMLACEDGTAEFNIIEGGRKEKKT